MTSNGKTLFYTTPKPVSSKRIYFGINSVGEPIFKDSNNNSIYIYQKESKDSISHQHETIAGPVKIKGDINQDKTYFMAIGKTTTNTEIFDYENYENELKIIKYDEIIIHETSSYLGNIIDLKEDGMQYYIVGLIKKENSQHSFYLIKFYLHYDSNNNIICESRESVFSKTCADNKAAYCHLSNKNNNIILCSYLTNDKNFSILFFDNNLEYNAKYLFIDSAGSKSFSEVSLLTSNSPLQ
jgi:hypothetical protein